MRRIGLRCFAAAVATSACTLAPSVAIAAAPDTAARTARVEVAGVVYRAVVPVGELGVAEPTTFLSLADRIQRAVSLEASPASVVLLDEEPVFQPAVPGRSLTASRVLSALHQSLLRHRVIHVGVATVRPPAEGADTTNVIVVHAGENRLYLYQDHVLSRTFPVATGSPDYPTPKGRFSIQVMRSAPTWINPHPTTGWGLTMPAVIPPGPTNPLGLRAMNLTAPNIRIHGTPQDRSVGYSVSHGCVRMHNSDVVQLFGLVGVGATVFIVQTAPPKLPPAGSGIATAIDPTLGG